MFRITVLVSALVLGYTIYIARRTDLTAVCRRIGTSVPSATIYYAGLLSQSFDDAVLTQDSRITRLRRCYPSLGNLQHSTIRLRS